MKKKIGWKIPTCDIKSHQRAIQEFSTGQKLSLCKWWNTVPKLSACTDYSNGILDSILQEEKSTTSTVLSSSSPPKFMMTSWRVSGAPMFTIMYRGKEVNGMQSSLLHHPSTSTSSTPTFTTTTTTTTPCAADFSSESKTIMFSHYDDECYVAVPCIQLEPGDPPMIVQYIVEDNGISCLKMVDVILSDPDHVDGVGRCPVERVAAMHSISKRWTEQFQNANMSEPSSSTTTTSLTNRRGAMWYGVASNVTLCQILDLRCQLHHVMECIVILTDDPHMQYHLPIKVVQSRINDWISRKQQQQQHHKKHHQKQQKTDTLLPISQFVQQNLHSARNL